ncbi:MAG: hypothetical protein D6757_05305 [Alphaproteobacteria bacterium]|nr:MAG: hypothetical protein D6757_05305 [Alphaproteobacteria bacterium]
MGIAGLFIAMTAEHAFASERGYGSKPAKPSRAIANLVGNRKVVVVVPPSPHAVRDESNGRWLYGWRVCALVGGDARLGYFLMRGNKVIKEVVGDTDPDNPATRSAYDRCGHPELPNTLTASNHHQPDSADKKKIID